MLSHATPVVFLRIQHTPVHSTPQLGVRVNVVQMPRQGNTLLDARWNVFPVEFVCRRTKVAITLHVQFAELIGAGDVAQTTKISGLSEIALTYEIVATTEVLRDRCIVYGRKLLRG